MLETNISLIHEQLNIALKHAKNDKELENSLKQSFKVEYVKFSYGSKEPYLIIADRKITQENLDFLAIIKKLKENREKEAQQIKAQQNKTQQNKKGLER